MGYALGPSHPQYRSLQRAWSLHCCACSVPFMLFAFGPLTAVCVFVFGSFPLRAFAEVYAGRTVIEQVKSWKEHADLGVYGTEKTKSILKCIALVEAHEG